MELEKAWFRPAACYLFAVRKMKKKEIAEIFGVDPHTVARAINRHEETGEHKTGKAKDTKERLEATKISNRFESSFKKTTTRRNGMVLLEDPHERLGKS